MNDILTLSSFLSQATDIKQQITQALKERLPERKQSRWLEIMQLYQEWYTRCCTLLPDDLREQFIAEYTGGNPDHPKIKDFLANPDITKWFWWIAGFQEPLQVQHEILFRARRRLISQMGKLPRSVVPGQVKQTIAAICKRGKMRGSIEKLFLESGCEPHWWVLPFKPTDSERMNEVYGWLDGILLYRADQEGTIVATVCDELLQLQRLTEAEREHLETWLACLQTPVTNSLLDQLTLHPEVKRVAGPLVADGHYRQALLDVYIALVEAVKTKTGRNDLDGVPLMQQVFSVNAPNLRLSPDRDEQLGYMWLFSGAVMAIRNPRAHKLTAHPTSEETLEWLAFASALFRILDSV